MKIRIHPALYVYLLTMTALSSWKTCAGAAAALLVHEIGHLLVAYLLGDRIAMLELTPLGGVMTYAEGRSPSKGIKGVCIAAAGPAANYLFLTIAATFAAALDDELIRAVVSSNAAMLCVNLLPVLPLDGGRIVFCLGYYMFPVSKLISALSWMGVAAGIGFLFLAAYGAVELRTLNCSVVIIGLYMMYCARESRNQMMMENLYTVIQERSEEKEGIRPIQVYAVSPKTQMIRLVPYLGEAHVCEFVFGDESGEHRVSEKVLFRRLLENPLTLMEDIFLQ